MADIKEVMAKIRPKDFTDEITGKPKAFSSYKIVYDSPQNQLEPIYYWLLDFMGHLGPEKITDNFMASPGSGQFSEMGAKATAMQQQATKILADTNVVIKSIIQLIYDLKEFEIRLSHYEKAKSDKKEDKESGMLALKNIWLDQVDLKRGRGSIHQMAAELGYTTIREVFLMANSVDDLEKMSKEDGIINDQVKRVLIPRLGEFLTWKEISEKEIQSRFNIEKSYLKSQVESLKMYTKWAKPYLKAAEELRMKGFDNNAALVNAFSTSMFELTLMGKKECKIGDDADLKKMFGDYPVKRKYFAIYVVSLKYRGHLGQKAGQGGQSGYTYSFGGRVEITFDCYALNSEELELVKKILADEDVKEGLKLIENNTDVALGQLKEDIEKYTSDKKKDETKKDDKKEEDDINPFSVLFSFSKLFGSDKKEEKKKIESSKDIVKDNFVEEHLREKAKEAANAFLYTIYDVYKKAHGHASTPAELDNATPKDRGVK